MEGIERAKLKDRILQRLIDNYKTEHYTEHVYKQMDKPVPTLDHFDEIVKEMHFQAKQYFVCAWPMGVIFIASNSFTQEFLDKGGFTK